MLLDIHAIFVQRHLPLNLKISNIYVKINLNHYKFESLYGLQNQQEMTNSIQEKIIAMNNEINSKKTKKEISKSFSFITNI